MDVPKRLGALLLVASVLAGCSARSHFSKEIGNCQSFGVVYLSSRNFTSTGTVCGTVDKITADYICSSLEQGAAVDFGTAENKGVTGGTGIIEAEDLSCLNQEGCVYTSPSVKCSHSQDLVLKCSLQPDVCLPDGAIAVLLATVFFFFVLVPAFTGIGLCACAFLGLACRCKSPGCRKM